MGHYGDLYDAYYEECAREDAKELARLKKKFPNDPSKWGISLEERVKLLEERLNKLERR